MTQPLFTPHIDSGQEPGEENTRDLCRAGVPGPRAHEPRVASPLGDIHADSDQFGFRLLHELGRGGFSRVFLGQQLDLAGRLVVLKFSALEGAEPQTLAQLQHTHIVPIYSVHEDAGAGLRAVCMPYFGGATLELVIEQLWQGATPVAGQAWGEALRWLEPPLAPTRPTEALPPLARLCQQSFVSGAVWLAARLAEALQHAHQRGVVHRDIKPSNILIGADGQPLLLDFNVAANDALAPEQGLLGGTVAFAAPEHIEALYSRRAGDYQRVDGRSDIYSLGVVLFKVLTGVNPFDAPAASSADRLRSSRTVPSARRYRADLPWGIESILRRCLAPSPPERYRHAGELAEDLNRFLNDQPLHFAPELSYRERLQKWSRRHPRLVSAATVAVVAALVLTLIGTLALSLRRHLNAAEQQLAASASRERREAFEQGTLRALCLVNTVSDLPDQRAHGARACADTLGLFGVLDHADWQRRPAWQELTRTEQRRLAEQVRELLLLLAAARVRAQPHDQAVLHDALTLLDRAAAIPLLAPSHALALQRAHLLELQGETERAAEVRRAAQGLAPADAQDHYLLAAIYAQQPGEQSLRRALAELERALALNPRHYWALAQRGLCWLELGEQALALADFSMCIGLWPDFAWGHFNRGYVLVRSGHAEQALRDFGTALTLEPGFTEAYLNRGLLQLERKDHAAALGDFEAAVRLGRDEAFVQAGRGMALEGLRRYRGADAAFAQALERAAALPVAQRNRILWTYASAVQLRLPEQARAAFEQVLAAEPRHPQALYGVASLAAARGQSAEALSFFDRAVSADADFVPARRGRALVRARLGHWEAASEDMNWCLAREPRHGVTLYAAACVAALAADQLPSLLEQSLSLLEKAFAQGYGVDQAATDVDLRALHDRPDFRRLLAANRDKTTKDVRDR